MVFPFLMSRDLENFYKMIKQLFLKHKGKPTITEKEHCSYADANSIGILYHADDFGTEPIQKLKELLVNDGKDVALLGFVEKPSENALMFHKKDISNTGVIRNDNLTFFIEQPFDFLLSLDTSGNMNYRYVLALSKAICKVGFENLEYHDLLQLSLKMDENKPKAIANMARYLKMIA